MEVFVLYIIFVFNRVFKINIAPWINLKSMIDNKNIFTMDRKRSRSRESKERISFVLSRNSSIYILY